MQMKAALKFSIAILLALSVSFAEAAKKERDKNAKNAKGDKAKTEKVERKAVKDVPVAEGFPHWKGFETWLPGSARQLTPSDLRGRYAVVVEMKGNKASLLGQFKRVMTLQFLGFNPSSQTSWDFGLPHSDVIVVFNIHDAGEDVIGKDFSGEEDIKKELSQRAFNFYTDLTFEGAPDAQSEYPFVYVMPPEGMEPIFKAKANDDIRKQVGAAIKKAKAAPKTWHDYYGYVEEVKHTKGYDAAIAGGKTLMPIIAALRKGIVSTDPEVAKESQMLYDAIEQRKGDLEYFIAKEWRVSAAAAISDYNELVARFPAMKKDAALKGLVAKAQAVPDISSVMKVYPPFRIACDVNRRSISPSEAKKLAADMKKSKAVIDKLANSKTIHVQNLALLMQQMLDERVSEMEAKAAEQ